MTFYVELHTRTKGRVRSCPLTPDEVAHAYAQLTMAQRLQPCRELLRISVVDAKGDEVQGRDTLQAQGWIRA